LSPDRELAIIAGSPSLKIMVLFPDIRFPWLRIARIARAIEDHPMDDAGTLILYEKYTDSTGTERETRVAPGTMEWMITAKNKKTYVITFENNFAKKHLYTETKKEAKVAQEAKRLWDELSREEWKAWLWKGYWLSYPPEILAKARKNVNEAKFRTQSHHRSGLEGEICSACKHPTKSHQTNSGNWRACKYKVNPAAPECGCAAATGGAYATKKPYADKRAAQGKPTLEPSAGARTEVNTIIVMNKIPATTMKDVISDAIIVKEQELAVARRGWGEGNVGLNADCEAVDLDFGPALTGCVMVVRQDQGFDDWVKRRGVQVKVKDLHSGDANRPRYAVVHYEDTIPPQP
jgi:hypothetical protein